VAVMRFDSGALGIIHGTTAAYPGLDASVRVFGTKGSAVISDDLVYFHRNAGQAPELHTPVPAADTNQVTDADALTVEQHRLGAAHVAAVRRLPRCDQIRSTGPGRHPGSPRRARRGPQPLCVGGLRPAVLIENA
jgi:UDP-N-acetyl-2-amino-2-deoxyglucuronate dehydrogenase